MSGEPKTLTLEEFMAELGNERNVSLARYKYPDGTEQWAANDSWGNLIEWAHTWPELGTKLWGVPVVPRDDTAELVEALEGAVVHGERLLDSLSHPVFPGRPAFDGRVFKEHRDEAKEALRVARAVLARVKGGER